MAILDLSAKENRRKRTVAIIISTVTSPIFLITLALGIINFESIKANPDHFLIFCMISGIPALVVYILPIIKKKRKLIDNDAVTQKERNTIFIVVVVSLVLSSIFFSYEQLNNQTWVDLSIVLATYFGAFFVVNMFFDKASQHIGGFVFSVVYLSQEYKDLLLLLAIMPIITWARIFLKRHTWIQIIWGIAIGIFVGILSLRV